MPEASAARRRAQRFEFVDRRLDSDSGRLEMTWKLDDLELIEVLEFSSIGGTQARHPGLEPALDALHWIAGVSYFKALCPPELGFAGRLPGVWQARALDRIYREGLAEFAWRNGLDRSSWPEFPAGHDAGRQPGAPGAGMLEHNCLVPMGGGKDSLVALERVRRIETDPVTVQVGGAPLIGAVARAAGTRHRVIRRRLAPELAELNAAGAFNGHVPVTAINAAVLTVAALVWGFDCVVFANERSADEPSRLDRDGAGINHQFSKSFEFEVLWQDWVSRYIAPDLHVFSILRRDRELAVCREFAGLEQYHGVFSSCNRNFHLDGRRAPRWCGACPKCHFVFLALAPFLDPGALVGIFGRDLLADRDCESGFRALLALDGQKPFECVGEAAESRAAVRHLAAGSPWSNRSVIKHLAAELESVAVPSLESLLEPGGPHAIPERFADAT